MLKKSLIAGIVMIVGMTGSMLYGFALGAEQDKAMNYNNYELYQVELFLDSKGKDYVVADDMRFEITSDTVIKNGQGEAIMFERLSIPCKAVVKYYNKFDQSNTYVTVSIQEKRVPQ